MLAAMRRDRRRTVQRRLKVMILTLRGGLTVVEIAERAHVNRSTVHSYRRLYRTGGIEKLLNRLASGRPRVSPSTELEDCILKGLRRLRWFHLESLQKWLRYHGHVYPDRAIRRWARNLVDSRKMVFPVAWQEQRLRALNDSVIYRGATSNRKTMPVGNQATLNLLLTG